MVLSFLFRIQVCHLSPNTEDNVFSHFPEKTKVIRRLLLRSLPPKYKSPSVSTQLSFLRSLSFPWALEVKTFHLPWEIQPFSNLLSQTSSTFNHALSLFLNPHLPPVTPSSPFSCPIFAYKRLIYSHSHYFTSSSLRSPWPPLKMLSPVSPMASFR